jgi:Smg protein
MNQNLKEDFLDVLLYLFEYYSEDPVRETGSNTEIKKHLMGAGFEDDVINQAMDWVSIFKSPADSAEITIPQSLSVRIFSNEEKSLLDNECQNYIIRLEKFGLLTPQKRELLIDKLTSIGFEPMDIEVVKALSILMLFQEPSVEVRLHAYDGEDAFDKPKTLN